MRTKVVEIDAYLEDGHSERIYIGGFRREFRREFFRESKLIRDHHLWCSPPDGVSSFSDLIILLDGCGRFCLILQSTVVDDPRPAETSQSSTEVRIYEDIHLKRRHETRHSVSALVLR